jgi:hypothetical protein
LLHSYLQSHANDEVGNAAEAASANDFGVAMGRGDVERLRSDVARASPMEEGEFLLCTVTFHANHAHNLTRSP